MSTCSSLGPAPFDLIFNHSENKTSPNCHQVLFYPSLSSPVAEPWGSGELYLHTIQLPLVHVLRYFILSIKMLVRIEFGGHHTRESLVLDTANTFPLARCYDNPQEPIA
jgi:hypothetical protein